MIDASRSPSDDLPCLPARCQPTGTIAVPGSSEPGAQCPCWPPLRPHTSCAREAPRARPGGRVSQASSSARSRPLVLGPHVRASRWRPWDLRMRPLELTRGLGHKRAQATLTSGRDYPRLPRPSRLSSLGPKRAERPVRSRGRREEATEGLLSPVVPCRYARLRSLGEPAGGDRRLREGLTRWESKAHG